MVKNYILLKFKIKFTDIVRFFSVINVNECYRILVLKYISGIFRVLGDPVDESFPGVMNFTPRKFEIFYFHGQKVLFPLPSPEISSPPGATKISPGDKFLNSTLRLNQGSFGETDKRRGQSVLVIK